MGSVKDYFSSLGSGIASLLKGMQITGKEFITPKITEKYPEMAAEWLSKYQYPDFVEKLTSFSFPSGHTSSAFAACAAILFLNKKLGIPAIVFAAIMGFSRIYVEVHYCTDVIGGAIVGIIYAVIGVLIAKALYPVVEKVIAAIKEKVFKKKAA